jgi:hypothetical protein
MPAPSHSPCFPVALLGVIPRVLDDTHTSASSAYVIQNEASQETQTFYYYYLLQLEWW